MRVRAGTRRTWIGLALSLATASLVAKAQISTDNSAPQADASTTADGSTTPPIALAGAEGKSAPALHALSLTALRAGQNTRALELLRLAVEREPTNCQYVTDLGYVLLKQGKWTEAEAQFRLGISLDATRPHAYVHLVDSIVKQANRWEKRQELFAILETGRERNLENTSTRLKIELGLARAEFEFGLLANAKLHLEAISDAIDTDDLRSTAFPPAQRRQLQELQGAIALDARARSLEDWPEPLISTEDESSATNAIALMDGHHSDEARNVLVSLVERYPAWRKPRRLLSTLLTQLGRYDEAVNELTVLARLAPSDPLTHRDLGLLLVDHGGALSATRADEELRIALSLEPEWIELEGIRTRLRARKESLHRSSPKSRHAKRPSENAIRLHDEALELLESGKDGIAPARDLLEQALRESPTYAAAAAALYSLTQVVPKATVAALWNDGEGLVGLYQEFRRAVHPPPHAVLLGWLDRSVEQRYTEALFARALYRKSRNESAQALQDLASYLAEAVTPEQIDAARSLRAELFQKVRGTERDHADPLLLARLRLQDESPESALLILGAPCRAEFDFAHLFALGMVYERLRKDADALACYETALNGAAPDDYFAKVAHRAARLLARADTQRLRDPIGLRLTEFSKVEPAALFALARIAAIEKDPIRYAKYLDAYLASAVPSDRFMAEARTLRDKLKRDDAVAAAQVRKQRLVVTTASVSLLLLGTTLLYWFRYRGDTLARALRRKPRLYPEVSRIIAELRHDVLKHRTSALGLLRDGQTSCAELRLALLEPTPTSTVVTEAYAELSRIARSEHVTLRRMAREPCFGRFVSDLVRVERLLSVEDEPSSHVSAPGTALSPGTAQGNTDSSTALQILAIDERLRNEHAKNLKHLLSLGPTCDIDAAELQRWIEAAKSEYGANASGFIVPSLSMSDLSLRFPVDKQALHLVFLNLLRNAQAAVRGDVERKDSAGKVPYVAVVLRRSQDFTGQSLVQLLVGDNANTTLTLAEIESREPVRGLGILRDTIRHWRGKVVVLPGDGRFNKYVGAQFVQ